MFTVSAMSVVDISGVTVRNGLSAISNPGTLTLTNTSISDNIGTAIYNEGGTLTVRDSVMADNTSRDNGGAIYNRSRGSVTVTNSSFSGNTGNIGGAINNFGDVAIFMISNSTFDGNRSTRWGGAIAASGKLVEIADTTITNNVTAEVGGGGIVNFTELILTRTMVSRNTANNRGGGIWNTSTGTLLATNSTISLNRLSGNDTNARGGGIETDTFASTTLVNTTVTENTGVVGPGINVSGPFGSVVLQNSIVAHNQSGTDCANTFGEAPITSNSHNIDGDGSCNLIGTGIIKLQGRWTQPF